MRAIMENGKMISVTNLEISVTGECLLEQLVKIDVCEKDQDGKYGLTNDGHLVFVTILLKRIFDDKLTNDELINKLIENGEIELKDNNMFCVTKKGIENVLLFLMWNFDNKNVLEYIKKYKRYVNRFNNSQMWEQARNIKFNLFNGFLPMFSYFL